MVGRWFRDLTDKQIRRGVLKSVADLIAAIQAYVKHHNSNPKSFVWTAKAEDIIAKYRRSNYAKCEILGRNDRNNRNLGLQQHQLTGQKRPTRFIIKSVDWGRHGYLRRLQSR